MNFEQVLMHINFDYYYSEERGYINYIPKHVMHNILRTLDTYLRNRDFDATPHQGTSELIRYFNAQFERSFTIDLSSIALRDSSHRVLCCSRFDMDSAENIGQWLFYNCVHSNDSRMADAHRKAVIEALELEEFVDVRNR
jgi:hypothetical protein